MTRIVNNKVPPRPEPNRKARIRPEIHPPDGAKGESAGGDAVLIGLDSWEEGSSLRGEERACAILEVSVGMARYLSRLIERDLARKRGHRAHTRAQSLVMFLRDCVDEVRDDDRERKRMRRAVRRAR